MSFYLVDIKKSCQFGTCKKDAVVALYSPHKTHFANYCKKHGDKELTKRKKENWT